MGWRGVGWCGATRDGAVAPCPAAPELRGPLHAYTRAPRMPIVLAAPGACSVACSVACGLLGSATTSLAARNRALTTFAASSFSFLCFGRPRSPSLSGRGCDIWFCLAHSVVDEVRGSLPSAFAGLVVVVVIDSVGFVMVDGPIRRGARPVGAGEPLRRATRCAGCCCHGLNGWRRHRFGRCGMEGPATGPATWAGRKLTSGRGLHWEDGRADVGGGDALRSDC